MRNGSQLGPRLASTPVRLLRTGAWLWVCGLLLAACLPFHEELPEGIESTGGIEILDAPAATAAAATEAAGGSESDLADADTDSPFADQATGDLATGDGATDDRTDAPGAESASDAPVPGVTTPPMELADLRDLLIENADGRALPQLAGSVEASVTARLAEMDADLDAEAVAADVAGALALPEDVAGPDGATTARLHDMDDDGDDDLLLAIPVPVLPMFVFTRDPSGWTAHQLPPRWPRPDETPLGRPQLEDTVDLTGDSTPEIVYSFLGHGASATVTELRIATWIGDGFRDVFVTTLDDWAGPAPSSELWTIRGTGDDAAIETRCAAFGAFDAKLLPHPTLTRTYVWSPARELFELEDTSIEDPASARQAANAAEAALRSGDLSQATSLYEAVHAGDYPIEDVEVDWRELAGFRLGLIHALSGRAAQARIAMGNVAAGAGPLAGPAQTFLDAYSGRASAAAISKAVAQREALASATYAGDASGLPFPLAVDEVLWPGLPLMAWLSERGIESLGEEPATTLAVGLGLPVDEALAADLDGDGDQELAVILPAPTGAPDASEVRDSEVRDLWLADPSTDPPTAHRLQVGVNAMEAVTLPGGTIGLVLDRGGVGRAGLDRVGLGWTGDAVTLHEPDPPYRQTGFHPEFDPRPGREGCQLR